MENVLEVYTKENGPALEFVKALKALYEKYGYIYDDDRDYNQTLKDLIQKEYNAVFVNDESPKLIFENVKQKTVFLIRFN